MAKWWSKSFEWMGASDLQTYNAFVAQPLRSRVLWLAYDALYLGLITAIGYLGLDADFPEKLWFGLAAIQWTASIFWIFKLVRGFVEYSRGMQLDLTGQLCEPQIRRFGIGWMTWFTGAASILIAVQGLARLQNGSRQGWEILLMLLLMSVQSMEKHGERTQKTPQPQLPETSAS